MGLTHDSTINSARGHDGRWVGDRLGEGAANMSARRVHVGRNSIHDRARSVIGYELSFRDHGDSSTTLNGDDSATTSVILSTFTDFGLQSLVGDRLAFINMTAHFLTGRLPVPFAPEGTVLEILGGAGNQPELVDGVQGLIDQGYVFALDDFVPAASREALLRLVSYVKVDVRRLGAPVLGQRIDVAHACGAQVVAEHVDSAQQLADALALGADFVQGFAVSRPEVVAARQVTPGQAVALQIFGRLADPEIELAEVEELVSLDPALSYRVLNAANSAATGASRTFSSIREAVVMLGLDTLRSWLMLMGLDGMSSVSEDLLSSAAARARTCELLARETGWAKPDSAFTVGLLSCLDWLLSVPLSDVLEHLPVKDDLRLALSDEVGPLGRLIAATRAYEVQDIDTVEALGLDVRDLGQIYLAAVGWSLQTCQSVVGS
jgi:c-di-GMP-related signal transduction protein